jgi:hypothetical protein
MARRAPSIPPVSTEFSENTETATQIDTRRVPGLITGQTEAGEPSPVEALTRNLARTLPQNLVESDVRWSARRSLAFILVTSLGLWGGIIWFVRSVIS